MNSKTSIILLIGCGLFLGSIIANPGLVETVNNKPSSINSVSSPASLSTNGTIPGTNIIYNYGQNTFDASNSFQVTNNGTVYDSYEEQNLANLTLDLVNLSSIVFNSVYYRVVQFIYNSTANSTNVLNMDNATFTNTYIPALNSSGLLRLDSEIPNFSVVDTAIVTTTGDYLGTFPTNTTLLIGHYAATSYNITLLVADTALVISYTPVPTQVQLNYTLSVQAALAYFNAYNVTYHIHAEQWSAQIHDGDRMGMYVSAFKSLNVNYTQITYSILNYYIASSIQINLKYMNGTTVPWYDMPFSLRPAYFEQQGSIQDLNINFVNTTSLVATTTAVQAFQAKLSKSIGANANVSASAFTAWMVSSVPRLLAYKDANLNNQLDLQYNPINGLQQSSGDYIQYMGALEATKGDAISYSQLNQTYNQTYLTFQGFQFINQTQIGINNSQTNFFVYHKAFGSSNVTAPPSFNPYWNGYTNNSGTYVFNFGVTYNNFPVDWVNLQNGSQSIVPMNITYDYSYSINPYTGQAKLSPTITYGAIADSGLKAAMQGLSLAAMYESDFLSATFLQATRLENATSNVTSSIASGFASVSFAGPQNNFTNVDTGGKATYFLDGNPYTAQASILNLASFSGTASSQNVTVFQSDNANIMNSAMMKQTTNNTLNLNYRKDLILISYPQWNGGKIIHDPSFSAVYQPNPAAPKITAYSADSSVNAGDAVVLQWATEDPDNNPSTYQIKDGSGNVVASGSWYSGEIIQFSFTAVQGTNAYTLIITDKDGNTASHTITITGVTPTTTPPPTSTGGTSTSGTTSGSSGGSSTNPSSSQQATTTPPLVKESTSKITSSIPGFTLEILFVLSILGLLMISRRKYS